MNKLIEHNLFGEGLVPVDKQLLVDRYNQCLKDIGIKQTELTFFHIDKWGWSPEIAEEFKNKDYLCFGFANPYAIIVTPEQEQAVIYYPFHSFDTGIMDIVFNTYLKQISDITTQYGVWLEIHQEISTYRKPQDLLLINDITLKFHTPDKVIVEAREQMKLVKQFQESSNAWADQTLHAKLLDSALKHGDLRNRSFKLNQLTFSDTSNFYARAYDGLFILKAKNKTPLLILENETLLDSTKKGNHIEYGINDKELFGYLNFNRIIENELSYFKNDIFSVMTLRDNLLMDLTIKHFPDEEIDFSNDRFKNKYINMLSSANKLSDDFYALEEIIANLKRNASVNIKDYPLDIQISLSYPGVSSTEKDKKILLQLLSKISPIKNILLQYLFDRNQFYTDYQTWNDNKKDWAINLIKNNKDVMYNYKLKKS